MLIEDEHGEQFVVEQSDLYNNPMQANFAMAKMRKVLGEKPMRANPTGPEEEDEDLEELDEELDDELDDDDEDLDEDEELDDEDEEAD